MNIRKSNIEDKSQIINLLNKFDEYYIKNNILSSEIIKIEKNKDQDMTFDLAVEEYLTSDKYFTFVIEENNKLIGYICGYVEIRKDKVYEKKGWIEDYFVLEEFRNQGLGKKMMKVLTDKFKEEGCTILSLKVDATNKRSIDIYNKFGFIIEDFVMIKEID